MAEEKPTAKPTEGYEHSDYEATDANLGRVIIFSIALVVFIGVSFGVVLLLFNFFSFRAVQESLPPPPLLQDAEALPPGPRLQRVPANDLVNQRAEEEQILNNYGWVDQEAGVVRIPIDRAIELTLERGLPAREQNEDGE